MRRWSCTVPVLVAVACSALILGATPADAQGAAKLVVESATEPPDRQDQGGKFRATVTIANEGDRRSGRDTLRFFLSLGRRFSNDDLQRRLGGTTRIGRLPRDDQSTRRITIRIPTTIADGEYFLVTCLGRTATDTDNLTCRFSGQKMRIGGDVGGQAQSVTPVPGPPGPPGAGALQVIPRVDIPLGDALGPPIRRSGGKQSGRKASEKGSANRARARRRLARGATQDDEGSTSTTQLAKVGPVAVIGLCRATTNGDGGAPGGGFGPGFSFDEDGDEALIVFRLDEGAGTMSWRGPHGPRRNIEPGDTMDPQSIDDPNDDGGGTGKHLALATARDPAPVVGDPPTSGPQDDWETGWDSGSVFVATSGGTEFVLHAYAGIDVLGVGDRCVFGGGVAVLQG